MAADNYNQHLPVDAQAVGASPYPAVIFAGFFKRLLAFLIDMTLAGALTTILINPILLLTGITLPELVLAGFRTAIALLYFALTTYFGGGQTLGKAIVGLRVVALNDEKLTWQTVAVREIAGRFIHMYSILSLLYVLTAFTQKKQNLSDIICDTSVVDLKRQAAYQMGTMRS